MASDCSAARNQGLDRPSSQPQSPCLIKAAELDNQLQDPIDLQEEFSPSHTSRPDKTLKRSRSDVENDPPVEITTNSPIPNTKRARIQQGLAESGPDSVPFWGAQAIKPLTEANLERLQSTMSGSDPSNLSRRNSAPHRRVSELSSSKRSHSLVDSPPESSASSRACAASSPRFEKLLKDCQLDIKGTEKPNADDVDMWKRIMATERDSPEPDATVFHLTREQVKSKNEVSVVKRLSPMLFPYRDLPTNNQKTRNLVYIDDSLWIEWGSIKPGYLPVPKPDLTIAFNDEAFTTSELAKMTSPYILATSYAPSLTLEIKTTEQMGIAEKQNANNMIPLLQRDYALQKTNNMHRQMERRIRFVSSTHDTALQKYQAWFYVIKSDGEPKWCSQPLGSVNFEDPNGDGFQTARRYNLNLCEYISDTVFKDLRKALAGADHDAEHDKVEDHRGDLAIVHLNTPSASSAENKRLKR
ncbi:MAG: hypothetical protein Q9213_002386 [Squamulea squamosa]